MAAAGSWRRGGGGVQDMHCSTRSYQSSHAGKWIARVLTIFCLLLEPTPKTFIIIASRAITPQRVTMSVTTELTKLAAVLL